MLILSRSSFKHDTAAALFQDDTIVAAIENDKLVRSRSVGLPESTIISACRGPGQGGKTWT
jgi:predicted NodU family carbamoyl transferase